MNRERLTEQLKPEHRRAGFYLEDDEDFLYLKKGNEIVGIWLTGNVAIDAVLDTADRLLAEQT